jgi:hypothetical protein
MLQTHTCCISLIALQYWPKEEEREQGDPALLSARIVEGRRRTD